MTSDRLVWLIAVRLHRTDARRLAVETELRRVNAELEARVEARTRALAESEAQYRRLIDESPDGIMIHREGVIRFINPAGLRMFGYTSAAQGWGSRCSASSRPTIASSSPSAWRRGCGASRCPSWSRSRCCGRTAPASGSGRWPA